MDEPKIVESGQIFKKLCDCCNTWLPKGCFYRNKAKSDGLQNKCIDCIKDYKLSIKLASEESRKAVFREIFFIPNIYLVGYGRHQTFQHCCLTCERAFFCHATIKETVDIFCDKCNATDHPIPERNLSKINYFGNVVGWLNKVEAPSKQRNRKNYKKVYERDRYTCQYCGYNLQYAKEFLPLHIDHLKPWSAQGGNSLNNLCVACQECNLIASDKWFHSFEEKKEFILWEKKCHRWKEERKKERVQIP